MNRACSAAQIPVLTFTASVADDSAHLIAHGYFSGFDPAPISGNDALKGQIAGTADIDATVASLSGGVTIDAVAGDLNLTLEPSKVGDLVIDRAVVDGSYRDRSGEIRQLEIAGLDLSIQAQGTLALNDTGESHLTFKADSPRLQEIGALAGVPRRGHRESRRHPHRKPDRASRRGNTRRQRSQVSEQRRVVGDHEVFGADSRARVAAGGRGRPTPLRRL